MSILERSECFCWRSFKIMQVLTATQLIKWYYASNTDQWFNGATITADFSNCKP